MRRAFFLVPALPLLAILAWEPAWSLPFLAIWAGSFWMHRVRATSRVSLSVLLVLAVLAAFCSLLALFDPWSRFEGGTGPHLMGLDQLDRDIFSRVLYGNRNSVVTALAGSLAACGLGILAGGLLCYSPTWLKRSWNALIQAFLSIPVLIYYLLGVVFLEPGPGSLILLFGLTLWPEPARMVQVRIDELGEADFANTARMAGSGEFAVFVREILPNLRPVLLVNLILTFANAILLESVLGYLGLGSRPGTPSLGRLIQEGASNIDRQPQILLVSLVLLIGWIAGLRGLMRRLGTGEKPLSVQ